MNGKGSTPRPYALGHAAYQANHTATFGRRVVPTCPHCGNHQLVTVTRPKQPTHIQCVACRLEWTPTPPRSHP